MFYVTSNGGIKIYFDSLQLVKSPLNYTGGKFKLLPQILPLFPEHINIFYDLFGGGCNVAINVNANKIVYNDGNKFIAELVQYLATCDVDKELNIIDTIIQQYNLGKNTKKEYYYFRDMVYNQNPSPRLLFILSCFSLNYSIRFNRSGLFNQSCGNRSFSQNMRDRFKQFNYAAKCKNIEFYNKDFTEFNQFNQDDFVYLDPPYYPTVTAYTENNNWTINDEMRMYQYLDMLNTQHVKFALSNVSVYRDKGNTVLNEWAKQYIVHNLDFAYTNNNSHRKNNTAFTQEVLITNY
jgi:DNA adenine methylase Dam